MRVCTSPCVHGPVCAPLSIFLLGVRLPSSPKEPSHSKCALSLSPEPVGSPLAASPGACPWAIPQPFPRNSLEQAASRAHSCCQGGSAELAAHPAAVLLPSLLNRGQIHESATPSCPQPCRWDLQAGKEQPGLGCQAQGGHKVAGTGAKPTGTYAAGHVQSLSLADFGLGFKIEFLQPSKAGVS